MESNRYRLEKVERIHGGILVTFYDLDTPIGSLILREDNQELLPFAEKFIQESNGIRQGKTRNTESSGSYI